MKYLLAAGGGILLYMWWKQGQTVPNPMPQRQINVQLPGGASINYVPGQTPTTWNSMFPPSTGPQAAPGMINGY